MGKSVKVNQPSLKTNPGYVTVVNVFVLFISTKVKQKKIYLFISKFFNNFLVGNTANLLVSLIYRVSSEDIPIRGIDKDLPPG